MTEPTTAAGRAFSDEYFYLDTSEPDQENTLDAAILAIEAEARRAALDEAIATVEGVIFDLPIGDNVDYSRGYSAAVAVDRELLRDALTRLRDGT